MKYSEQVRKDAKAAADYIREHGWGKHAFQKRDGRVCAAGGIRAACNGDPRVSSIRSIRLEDAFAKAAKTNLVISRWNDRAGRTKEDVLAVFDAIANSKD